LSSRLMSASNAVREFVHPGACISIGGFTINRNPMAIVHEIIRQRIGQLHLVMHSGSQAMDLLVGAGLVDLLEIAYGANGRLAPTCVRFRRAVQEGTLRIEDYSNYQMTLRFMAGAMGAPFLPTYSGLGSDIIEKWGFDSRFRERTPEIPLRKAVVVEDPFSREEQHVVLVPAVNPDVTIIHVQKAAEDGTTRIEGLTFADIEQARASKHVIVSCEELVSPNELRQDPWCNSLPHVIVDAVVHQPFGAHPTACYRYYDYDMKHLEEYREIAADDERFRDYLEHYVLGAHAFDEYLRLIGDEQLDRLRASLGLGYARRDLL